MIDKYFEYDDNQYSKLHIAYNEAIKDIKSRTCKSSPKAQPLKAQDKHNARWIAEKRRLPVLYRILQSLCCSRIKEEQVKWTASSLLG